MKSIYNDTIGSGVIYPINLTPDESGRIGWHVIKGDTALIENNLCSIVNYVIGERFREEDFGTRVWECLEEPNTQALAFLVDKFMKDAISRWEPRITYKSSEITRESSKLHIKLHYVVNATNASKSATVTYNTDL